MTLEEIEKNYNNFYKKHKNLIQNCEFFGINLSPFYSFKIYSPIYNYYNNNDFLFQLKEKNMIRCTSKIIDTTLENENRIEIGLSNRTNENMNWLINYMYSIFPQIMYHFKDLSSLLSIKISADNNYRNAALYYLGLIKNNRLCSENILKLYFLLQKCENPDYIYKKINNDNAYFSQEIYNLNNKIFASLMDVYVEITKIISCDLWIAGVDINNTGPLKYKLYFKNFKTVIYNLIDKHFVDNEDKLYENYNIFLDWISKHSELSIYGIGLCKNILGNKSINFYYKFH